MNKKKLGQFFTNGDPFCLKQFKVWIDKALALSNTILEPFAGANNLIKKLQNMNYKFKFKSYDIEPKNKCVNKKDTILNFPLNFEVIVTNPPWLAKNSAKRKNIPIFNNWEGHDNLYKLCLQRMINNSKYIAAILPASFCKLLGGKKSFFFDRLESLTFLNYKMFNETENPSCLALFIPEKTKDTKIFIGSKMAGTWKTINYNLDKMLAKKVTNSKKTKIEFNKKKGNLGVITIDSARKKNIRFTRSEEIPTDKVKKSSRHLVRIVVNRKVNEKKIKQLNKQIGLIREITKDVVMTPFKGLIKNQNCYRRRMDFALIRKIINFTF